MHTRYLALCILLPLLVACGKKGPVRPLLKSLPAAVGQGEVRQVGSAIRLTFDLPEKNQNGSPLTDLGALRIYRRENPAGPCSECDEPNLLWREIDPEYPGTAARRNDNRLATFDGDILPGYGYQYRIEPVTRRGLAGESVLLATVAAPPLPPPAELTAVGLDRMVRLSWLPPATPLPAGWTLIGYTLYRASNDAPFGDTPLNAAPLEGERYEDIGPQNGRVYRYQVRYLAASGATLAESAESPAVAAIPHAEE